jgi:sugar fermentation stimulation protein A
MGSGWVGVNTSRVNNIIAMAVDKQEIPALQGYEMLKKEPRIDFSSFPPSRFDLLLSSEQRKTCYVEIKNATLLEAQTILFPDAVTERGRKHLLLLDAARKRGFRAVILFAINRPEGHFFAPAEAIDPAYAETLQGVHAAGVEILLLRLCHSETGVSVVGSLNLKP